MRSLSDAGRRGELERIERWLASAIRTDRRAGAERAAPPFVADTPRVDDVLLPARLLDASECLDIYRRMYRVRIEEALTSDYPALRAVLGAAEFRRLASDYIDLHPSRTYDLARVGDGLPQFVGEWPGIDRARRGWVVELTRLERAVHQAHDVARPQRLSLGEIASVPTEAWADLALVPADGLQVLAFQHPVGAVYAAFLADETLVAPRRHGSWIAVYRDGHGVRCLPLSRRAHHLLSALIAGLPLGAALTQEVGVKPRPNVQRRVESWLFTWVRRGLFQQIRRASV